MINHDIKPKYFKIILSSLWIYQEIARFDEFNTNLSNLGEYVSVKIILASISFLKILIELLIWNFVPLLILSIILTIFLNCIVCQMHWSFLWVFCIFIGGCPKITLLIKIALNSSINWGNHNKMSEIEFSPMIQQWTIQILLDYISKWLTV